MGTAAGAAADTGTAAAAAGSSSDIAAQDSAGPAPISEAGPVAFQPSVYFAKVEASFAHSMATRVSGLSSPGIVAQPCVCT